MKKWLVNSAAALLIVPGLAGAEPHEKPLRDLADSQIKVWASDPVIVEAIKAQNTKNAALSQDDIDALDQQWRSETKGGSGPMIDEVLARAVSEHLKSVKDGSQGVYTEIFVMDARGLNVGQSDVTSDYWQGDEAKWQETYKAGAGAVHVGGVEQDESTQMFQAQVSMTIADPASNEVIGAVTVGVNVDEVMR